MEPMNDPDPMPPEAQTHRSESASAGRTSPGRSAPSGWRVSCSEADLSSLRGAGAGRDIHPQHPQVYWADESGEEWIGLGEADRLESDGATPPERLPDQVRERLASIQASPEARDMMRYLGGIAFDPLVSPHPSWPAGIGGRFVLPRLLLRRKRGSPRCRWIQVERAGGEDVDPHVLRGLAASLLAPAPTGAGELQGLRLVESRSQRAHFEAAVLRALRAIEEGELRKVVLSRDLVFDSPDLVDPWRLMRRIASRNPRGVQFLFRFDPNGAFLGATPERLFVQEGRRVRSDCLAGTASRGFDADGDARLAELLRSSEKDRREHRFVLDGIVEALAPLCMWIEAPTSPAVQPLPMVQHLHTPVAGWLRPAVSLSEILRSLHPTPAVGGAPREAAIRWIRRLEGRPRGWYAGAVGSIGVDRADFAVGIRSAIVRDRRVTVFGGAGIVRGSEPAMEWEETARKAASLMSLFAEEGCPTPT